MSYPYTGDEIAIIGLSCRFPFSNTQEEYWRHLQAGKELISFFSEEELKDVVKDKKLLSQNYVRAKGYLEEALFFDYNLFGYNYREAALIDPQHRILLQCAWEALESAGYDPDQFPGMIGAFVGCNQNSYFLKHLYPILHELSSYTEHEELAVLIGNSNDYLATRLSFKLNLKGPSKTIQTACSTSLVAVHDACQSLLNYECDLALAGGASISFPIKSGYTYSPDGINSPDGHCRAFDAKASGTVFGDGVGIIALKRLDDALKDHDNIHAVIKGSAINNDGANKMSYFAPSVEGQARVIAAAIASANISAETISYVECHGTATALGDPIEIAALTQAFRLFTPKKQFCPIGSVKTNVGHLITAAGVASLIKTISMLKHKELPPSLFFEKANPNILFDESPFYVNRELRPWPQTAEMRRAAVSSFGIGGTNAHLIVEEAPMQHYTLSTLQQYLLPFSAATPETLHQIIHQMLLYLERSPSFSLGDIAFTLQVGRKALLYRAVFICKDLEDAKNQMRVFLERKESKSLFKEDDDLQSWLKGNKIDWSAFHEGKKFKRIPLPTYPFAKALCILQEHPIATSNPPSAIRKQPLNLIEKMLLSLWSHVFHEEHIDTQTDFFVLGGDSFTALEIVDHLRTLFCVDISLEDFFTHPNIQALACCIEEKKTRP